MTVTPSGSNKVLKIFMNTENQPKSKEWSSIRRKKKWLYSVAWQNPINPRPKKVPKNERVFLRGDWHMSWGIWARGKGHCTWVWLWMWRVPGVQLWNSSIDKGCSVCTLQACVLSLLIHALPVTDQMLYMRNREWESTSQNRRLWLCYFKFLQDLFSDYT